MIDQAHTSSLAIGLSVVIFALPTSAARAEDGSQPSETSSAFRVNPYLQQPSSDGMLIQWLTDTNVPGTLKVYGGHLRWPRFYHSSPEELTILQYDQRELDQAAEQGYIVLSNDNFKHAVHVRGLAPNTEYLYVVEQGPELFFGSFKTAPRARRWDHIRFIAFSDAETEPRGNTNQRDWSTGAQSPSSVGRPAGREDYPLTETEGYLANLGIVEERRPDFLVMPGDLVQGGGYQLGWDEFFRHNAGVYASPLSFFPILPALGNWENFGAVNGGYTVDPTSGDNSPAVGRAKFRAYFDNPSNGFPEFEDNFYRQDYGPVTVLTLDTSNGEPDQQRRDPAALDTDTQSNFTAADYRATGFDDLADFNPGSKQWNWVEDQLESARDQGQIIFVQFHHVPYSSGVHGFPMSSPQSSGQGGTPLRQYHSMFEAYGVIAVFSGHSEMFERSFVDGDGDGVGVHYYDVGVAGDGLRGSVFDEVTQTLGGANPFSEWTADQSEPETWVAETDGSTTLVSGGKHYGHLEVNIYRDGGELGYGRVEFSPAYSFPSISVTAAGEYDVSADTERRVYADTLTVSLAANNAPAGTVCNPADVAAPFGRLDADDFFAFWRAFFRGRLDVADLNDDGRLDSEDRRLFRRYFWFSPSCRP
ncbi:MAG: metallophosphoesterase family protein [Myxococcota bacterium]